MKTERRHELQHNELADWIQANYQRIQPYLTSIAAVLVAAVVLYWAYVTFSSRAAARADQDWALLSPKDEAADSLKVWTELASTHSASTPLGMAVRMRIGNYSLQEAGGVQVFNKQRSTEIKDFLNRAVTAFTELQKDAKDADVRSVATLKLAQTQEYIGNLQAAKAEYAKVAELGAKSPYSEFAKTRAADLGKQETKDFYQACITMMKADAPTTNLGRPSDTIGDTPGLPSAISDDKFKGFDNTPKGTTPPVGPPTPTPEPKSTTSEEKKPEAKPATPEDKKPEPTPEKASEKPAEKSAEKPADATTEPAPADKK